MQNQRKIYQLKLDLLKINSNENEIILGPKEKIAKQKISLKEINLLVSNIELDKKIFVKVRSTGDLLEAKVHVNDNKTGIVNLSQPEDGISPGQACVFYNKDQFGYKVLGGGWIKEQKLIYFFLFFLLALLFLEPCFLRPLCFFG